MPRLVVVSRYLKSGSSKNLSNYVKYIATREGAATVKENNGTAPATKKQQELISSLLKDFSYSKNCFSYEEYKNSPTQKNASKFIEETIEHNADIVANKKNYMGYLANRPGAVKFGSHGLFSQTDEPISLKKVAKEVSEHKGNVWTHVVSLRRDDAQKMGYDNLNAWRELIKRQIPNIAKQSKIDIANLKWYAAFHDKETNPHVHIVVYSTDEREGFLTEHGIEKIRSGFMNDIYADELKHLYQQQTDTRDLLKAESAKLMKRLSSDIADNNCIDTEIVDLMRKLHGQLRNTKGKKVYGYLNKDTKQTVDEIFLRLSQNESIHKMYKLWCDMEQSKHDFYSSAKVDFPAMVDNEQFKSVKNMIIHSVAEIAPVATVAGSKAIAKNDSDDMAVESDSVSENVDKTAAPPVVGNDNNAFASAVFGLMVNISRIIYDDYDREQRKLQSKVDKKLRNSIDRKKQELGIKSEYGQSY
ncbi:MobP3 family relaxase [Ruminococcus flavefaciens]|uniref:MobP3 family relaxase n=1 Tax=Ruminococcus flavefaciens TaxID=1265 RepID=UPI0026ED9E2C|nr:MobP3 family relaxase [Ruminococcus flavefaciens]